MKIILTNDDGIDAPGLETLHSIIQQIGTVVVVAPEQPQSWVSHRVTTHSPIRVMEVGKDRFMVNGTPADCSRIALKKIVPDASWIFSGINPGANLGSDVYNSGTVASAREAAILGCSAVAISQYIAKGHQIQWDTTLHHAQPIIRMLTDLTLEPGHFWNVNLPHPLNIEQTLDYVFCGLDIHPHKYEFKQE
ncbi:5'/3'-nucleotidase SurE, partial [Thermodesulfobacteriota bacterium]